MTPVELLLLKVPDAKKSGNGWTGCCPAHQDLRASLSIAEGEDGRALVKCHSGCTVDAICTKIGLRVSELMPISNTRQAPPKVIGKGKATSNGLQSHSTQRYCRRKPDDDRRLIDELRRWCEWSPRFGSERVHQMLQGTGWRVNFKRVHRLWKQEHLQVPGRRRKRRRFPGQSVNGCVRHRAIHRNHVWSDDFLVDRTEDGRQLKLLVVIDEFTRECLAAEVGRTFTSRDVRLTLQYLFAIRGAPEHIRSDNGPEFIAQVQSLGNQSLADLCQRPAVGQHAIFRHDDDAVADENALHVAVRIES